MTPGLSGNPPRLSGDAVLAAALLAVDPHGLGGISLRARSGPGREEWLTRATALHPGAAPRRKVPANVDDATLLGGLDPVATLSRGRPVIRPGLLAAADGGLVVIAMAERLGRAAVGHVASVLDLGEVRMERDGASRAYPARLAVIALDEGVDEDESTAPALLDRLAFHVHLDEPSAVGADDVPWPSAGRIEDARARLARVRVEDGALGSLCAAAALLGVDSMRPCRLAARAAGASAALDSRERVGDVDVDRAVRLVLMPRATRVPAPPESERASDSEPDPGPDRELDPGPRSREDLGVEHDRPAGAEGEERVDSGGQDVLAAARAALPEGLLARLAAAPVRRCATASRGRGAAGGPVRCGGRPAGTRPGTPRDGARLCLVETLRAAAPWQPVRRRYPRPDAAPRRLHVRAEDLRVVRMRQRPRTTIVFAVDASGSAAMHRLAEAKGAVELLLGDAYVRRDRVALVAFRGVGADVVLPPTRSLVRARRCLARLPGGGGTPLAAGLQAASAVASGVGRHDESAVVVVLTDGGANVAADGTPGRDRAGADAAAAAREIRLSGLPALVLDIAPRPSAAARTLAEQMGAYYQPMPHADAGAISLAARRLAEPASARERAA